MTHFFNNAQDSETSSQHAGIRLAELIDQNWSRNKSSDLAMSEGISLTDQHWDVLVYLRKQYLVHGLSRHARTTARALAREFFAQGGNKYLYRLFAGGPVTQAAVLPTCAYPQTPPTFHLEPAIEKRRDRLVSSQLLQDKISRL